MRADRMRDSGCTYSPFGPRTLSLTAKTAPHPSVYFNPGGPRTRSSSSQSRRFGSNTFQNPKRASNRGRRGKRENFPLVSCRAGWPTGWPMASCEAPSLSPRWLVGTCPAAAPQHSSVLTQLLNVLAVAAMAVRGSSFSSAGFDLSNFASFFVPHDFTSTSLIEKGRGNLFTTCGAKPVVG